MGTVGCLRSCNLRDLPRFVEEVKKQCAEMDAQWDERQKTRAEETEAITKAGHRPGDETSGRLTRVAALNFSGN